MKNRMAVVCGLLWMIAGLVSTGQADSWPMKQREQYHTGRADFVVPASRMNDAFFDIILWQTPAPGSPGEGNFGGSSMSFFDGAGPDESDIVAGTYHWPKGVQGMDRHTGKTFWYGNPDGGEYIARVTPGFSADGSTIYIINDSTLANGPLMAFYPVDGPYVFHDNRYDMNPEHLSLGSPLVCQDDGRIFAYSWNDRPYAAWDDGSDLGEVWAAPCQTHTCFNEPSLWTDMYGEKSIVSVGRGGFMMAFDDYGNILWDAPTPAGTDMTPTIDPDSGSIYVAVGMDHIYVVGLDIYGYPLWDAAHVHDFTPITQPERAVGTGCLSFDGATYYFQTVAEDGSGKLYAINTSDGSLKWTYDTQSRGWEDHWACPIVTQNNVIIVGNNDNDTYFAIEDQGQDNPVLLDSLSIDESGSARNSATLSSDGLLYLPMRISWTAGNGNGQMPDYTVQNLFCALDLTEDAKTILYPPGKQRAIAGNGLVRLKWIQVQDIAGVFDHYAIYRDTDAFSSVESMTPLATVDGIDILSYQDETAVNGISYYYAITTVTASGGEVRTIHAIGPRTPRDETDLQVVSISRTPFYPRYCVHYTGSLVTEESGFGPYWCSAGTGLCEGQDENTNRWPDLNEEKTYTAKIRNRGTNTIYENILITWEIDGAVVEQYDSMTFLMPGETKTWDYILPWDDQSHDICFSIDINDDRTENNVLESNTLAVGYVTYIDESFI